MAGIFFLKRFFFAYFFFGAFSKKVSFGWIILSELTGAAAAVDSIFLLLA
jgi:hypothetical protein